VQVPEQFRYTVSESIMPSKPRRKKNLCPARC